MKKEKTPMFVVVAALTTLTTILWVVFSVYTRFKTIDTYEVSGELIKPVNPTLDSATLAKIEQRFFVNESELPDTIVVETIEGEEPSATEAATPNPTIVPEFETTESTTSGEANQ